MTIHRILSVVAVLQALTLATLWFGSVGGPQPAAAQVPDAGAQRMQILDEIRGTNARLDKLVDLLASGKLQVHTVSPDDGKGR